MTRTPFAILSLSAAAVGGALFASGVAGATPAPAALAAPAATPSGYTVQPGDSLWAIGQRFGIPMQELAALNGMSLDDVLYAGRVLALTPTAASTPAPTTPAPTTAATTSPSSSATSSDDSSAAPSSSLERCVIDRESGGDSQITNASGHWGLYQFSRSTWEAYGGSSSDFGSASASEQHQVFERAIADGGASNWTAYDGC